MKSYYKCAPTSAKPQECLYVEEQESKYSKGVSGFGYFNKESEEISHLKFYN